MSMIAGVRVAGIPRPPLKGATPKKFPTTLGLQQHWAPDSSGSRCRKVWGGIPGEDEDSSAASMIQAGHPQTLAVPLVSRPQHTTCIQPTFINMWENPADNNHDNNSMMNGYIASDH